MSSQSQSQQSHCLVSITNQKDVGGIKQKEIRQDSPDATTEYIRPCTGIVLSMLYSTRGLVCSLAIWDHSGDFGEPVSPDPRRPG